MVDCVFFSVFSAILSLKAKLMVFRGGTINGDVVRNDGEFNKYFVTVSDLFGI